MPSIITGIIGGFQGSSAAHNAANAQVKGYTAATNDVGEAVSQANPVLSAAVSQAENYAGGNAANAESWAGGAANTAANGANNAATTANTTLLSPYVTNGGTASNQLSNLTSAGFRFDPSQVANTPGYQFNLQQGEKAIANSMAAKGMGQSGAAIKAGDMFAQNLASNTYQQAFGNALSTYNTNVSSLLPQTQLGLGASGMAGSNLMNAAEYGGNITTNAAEYAGNAGLQAAEYGGNAGMWGGGQMASNLLNAGVYAGNAAANSGAAIANGDINAANAWNGTLSSIGSGLTPLAMAGFGSGGWSVGNIAPNLGSLYPPNPSNGYNNNSPYSTPTFI
jgi:hypothetical protein